MPDSSHIELPQGAQFYGIARPQHQDTATAGGVLVPGNIDLTQKIVVPPKEETHLQVEHLTEASPVPEHIHETHELPQSEQLKFLNVSSRWKFFADRASGVGWDEKALFDALAIREKTYQRDKKAGTEPKPVNEYELAKDWQEQAPEIPDPLERPRKKKSFGKRGGTVESFQSSAFERFLAASVATTANLVENPQAWNDVVYRLTSVTDMLRYRYQQVTVNAPEALEAISDHMEVISSVNADTSMETTWDLLSRFEIPHHLAGNLLEVMDQHSDLRHPLAVKLLGMLPAEHPFTLKQQERISTLKQLCTGEPIDVLAHATEAEGIARHIISIFPFGVPEEKMGFDIEVWPRIVGVPMPEGVDMGIDGGGTVPELRLDPTPSILSYDANWRTRAADLYFWSKTSQAAQASMHLHVDQIQPTTDVPNTSQQKLLELLFGSGFDSFRKNSHHNTFEVRTALKNYPDRYPEGAGFPEGLRMISLTDFLVALRHAEPDLSPLPREVRNLPPHENRLATVLSLVSDPTARAAGLICLTSPLEKRISTLQQHDLRVLKDDIFSNMNLIPVEKRLSLINAVIGSYTPLNRETVMNMDASLYALHTIFPQNSEHVLPLAKHMITKFKENNEWTDIESGMTLRMLSRVRFPADQKEEAAKLCRELLQDASWRNDEFVSVLSLPFSQTEKQTIITNALQQLSSKRQTNEVERIFVHVKEFFSSADNAAQALEFMQQLFVSYPVDDVVTSGGDLISALSILPLQETDWPKVKNFIQTIVDKTTVVERIDTEIANKILSVLPDIPAPIMEAKQMFTDTVDAMNILGNYHGIELIVSTICRLDFAAGGAWTPEEQWQYIEHQLFGDDFTSQRGSTLSKLITALPTLTVPFSDKIDWFMTKIASRPRLPIYSIFKFWDVLPQLLPEGLSSKETADKIIAILPQLDRDERLSQVTISESVRTKFNLSPEDQWRIISNRKDMNLFNPDAIAAVQQVIPTWTTSTETA